MNDQDLERGMSSMTTFILGAALGAGIALLLAPDRGSETRRRVGQTMKRFGSQVNDRMDDVKENVRSAVNSGRDAFRRTSDDLRSNSMANEQSGTTNP
jgi:gas vesicle protein